MQEFKKSVVGVLLRTAQCFGTLYGGRKNRGKNDLKRENKLQNTVVLSQ